MNPILPLVENRDCGKCSACCVTLRIETEGFNKLADESCHHLIDGCAIYESRPEVCRTWYCAWRYMAGLDEYWRPDKSNVLLRFRGGERPGIILQSLGLPQEVFETERSLGLVTSLIENGIPVFISVPGKAGHCNAIIEVNERLAQAIETRRFIEMQAAMREAVNYALQLQTDQIAAFHSGRQQPRLEKCACGSGKKFKHCHGKL